MEEEGVGGLCSGCDPHRLSCLSGHNKAGMATDGTARHGLSHATVPAWLAALFCLSHWLPLINSQGLSAGRSGADSWMRRSGMPRYSVRASCLQGGGVVWAGGRGGLMQFLHVGLLA